MCATRPRHPKPHRPLHKPWLVQTRPDQFLQLLEPWNSQGGCSVEAVAYPVVFALHLVVHFLEATKILSNKSWFQQKKFDPKFLPSKICFQQFIFFRIGIFSNKNFFQRKIRNVAFLLLQLPSTIACVADSAIRALQSMKYWLKFVVFFLCFGSKGIYQPLAAAWKIWMPAAWWHILVAHGRWYPFIACMGRAVFMVCLHCHASPTAQRCFWWPKCNPCPRVRLARSSPVHGHSGVCWRAHSFVCATRGPSDPRKGPGGQLPCNVFKRGNRRSRILFCSRKPNACLRAKRANTRLRICPILLSRFLCVAS